MPSLIPLDSLLGAAFIGILVSTAVYGITCLQGYIYYTENSSGDKRYLKTFVGVLILLDTFHVILLGIFYYRYSVTNFGDYIQLQAISTWSLLAQVVVEDIIALMVQFFFAYRIYQLSKNWIIPVIICILSIGQFGCGIRFTVTAVGVKVTESARTKTWTISGMAISAACDVVITASMIYYLWSEKRQVKLSRGMNRTINSLMRYSLNTGFLTTVFALATAITFVENETAFIYGPFFFVLSRMYACSFLAVLNTRHHLREKLNGDVELYASGQPAYPSAIAFASGGTHTTASNMDISQDSVKAPKAF
ncbi:hypothetical protein B0H14DRAFT_2756576 [Mycena olivaceomarginata]|nr:hypothetical protein B0H14DRAFT_2980995 [Mycena olivaceomarginata]KAJ7854284.1 hypothetical protein B0H14DRAFT_2756576 [Mycena olivaceomarginata]